FNGRQEVAGNVDDVVDTSQDPDIAVVVGFCTVAGQKPAATVFGPVEIGPVRVIEALRIAPHRAGSTGAGTGDDNDALLVGFRGVARVVDHRDIDAGQRTRTRSGLEGFIRLTWGDDGGTGFGLPPGVDHGYALGGVAANVGARPVPGLGVHGFAHGAD